MTQPDLFAVQSAPSVSPSEVDQLLTHLAGQGWRTAKQIEKVLGWNERKVRAIAQHAGGQILGTDRGYRLTVEATSEEMREWDGRYKSQIDRMSTRRSETWLVFTRGAASSAA